MKNIHIKNLKPSVVIANVHVFRFFIAVLFNSHRILFSKQFFFHIIFKDNPFFKATLEAAVYFRDSFRAQEPVRYSTRRRSDEPTPPLSPTQNNTPSSPTHSQANSNANLMITPISSQSLSPVQNQTTANSHTYENVEIDEFPGDDTQNEDGQIDESIDREGKSIMPNVVLEEQDLRAINAICDSGDDDASYADFSQNTNRHSLAIDTPPLAPGEIAFYDNDGVLKIKKKYSDDCEVIHEYGMTIKPKIPVFEIKVNDLISGNIPFKENVCKKCKPYAENYKLQFPFFGS